MSELVILDDGLYEKVSKEKLVKEITDKVMEKIEHERSKSTDSK